MLMPGGAATSVGIRFISAIGLSDKSLVVRAVTVFKHCGGSLWR